MAVIIGESNLTTLLTTLQTTLHPSTFVFVTLPGTPGQQLPPPSLPIQMFFAEAEGTTLITTKQAATTYKLEYTFPCRMITLNVHSSLEAVGFMSKISAKLTEKGIGVNPVSGFWHDHCFVPVGREEEAMKALEELVREAKGGDEDLITLE
jgi:hypothetical protein